MNLSIVSVFSVELLIEVSVNYHARKAFFEFSREGKIEIVYIHSKSECLLGPACSVVGKAATFSA